MVDSKSLERSDPKLENIRKKSFASAEKTLLPQDRPGFVYSKRCWVGYQYARKSVTSSKTMTSHDCHEFHVCRELCVHLEWTHCEVILLVLRAGGRTVVKAFCFPDSVLDFLR